jgi:hypothetical protein
MKKISSQPVPTPVTMLPLTLHILREFSGRVPILYVKIEGRDVRVGWALYAPQGVGGTETVYHTESTGIALRIGAEIALDQGLIVSNSDGTEWENIQED